MRRRHWGLGKGRPQDWASQDYLSWFWERGGLSRKRELPRLEVEGLSGQSRKGWAQKPPRPHVLASLCLSVLHRASATGYGSLGGALEGTLTWVGPCLHD